MKLPDGEDLNEWLAVHGVYWLTARRRYRSIDSILILC